MGIGGISAHAGYLLVGLFFISIALVGWRRVCDPRRIACIYFVTYWFRPLLEYIIFRD